MTEGEAHERHDRAAHYRNAFDATTDGVFIADHEGVIVEANPAFCALYDYHRDELVGRHLSTLSRPDSPADMAAYIEAVAAAGSLCTTGLSLSQDGILRHVEARVTTFTHHGHLHLLGVDRDITAQIATEAQLREREEQYRAIFDASNDALFIVDTDGVIVEANAAGCRMYGYTYDELVGLRLSALTHPDDRPAKAAALLDVRRPVTRRYVTGLRKDGSQFPAESQASAFMYGGKLHVLDTTRDITERVQAEQAVNAVNEERLRLSRELHDSVSQALYSIGLGARTARTLLERNPAEAVEPMEFVLSQAEIGLAEMRALIFDLRPEALQQNGLVAALQRQAAAAQARHGVQIEFALCEEPALPLPDKEALYRIAQEALNNAIRHARAKTVEIRLEASEGGFALEVRDGGHGFDAHGPFPGHLGLQTMRERAARVGGRLDIDSTAGKGTLIRAWVPDERTHADAAG